MKEIVYLDPTAFSRECSLNLERLGKIKFSNKGEGELNVVGSVPAQLKLKIDGTKDDISFSFKGVTASSPIAIFGDKSKGKIILRDDRKFKDVGGKLTKSASVDETLKKFNGQLEKLNAPVECRFDETETEESVECSVSGEQLKTMPFSADNREIQTLSDESFSGMKLNVQIVKKLVKEVSDMVLAFKGYDKTIGVFGEGCWEIVSLVKNTNPEFEIKGDVENSDSILLGQMWYSTTLGDSLGLKCNIEDGEIKGECTFTGNSAEINVGKGTGDEFEKLTIKNTSGKSFELHAEEEGYNQGFKFVFRGETVSGGEGAGLESDSSYEFRWKLQDRDKVGYLVKRAQ